MKSKPVSFLFTMTVTIMSCCILQSVQSQTVVERIQVPPGPEDMVLDTLPASPRLIISCSGRREAHKPFGEIVSMDLRTGGASFWAIKKRIKPYATRRIINTLMTMTILLSIFLIFCV